jgi:hypothetical protein
MACKKEHSTEKHCGIVTEVTQLNTQIKFPDGSYIYIRDTTFINFLKLKKMDTTVTENPLFAIAREKQKEDLRSGEYVFLLNDTEETYVLGFCRGVAYATEQTQKLITMFEEKIKNFKIEQDTF